MDLLTTPLHISFSILFAASPGADAGSALNLANPARSGASQFLGVLWIAVVFVFVLAMAYFFTKWFASAKTGALRGRRANIRLVESMGVGMQSYVQIVKVGKKYVLVGVTKGGVSMLAELDPADLELARENPANILPFEKILRQYFPKMRGNKGDEAE
ncbi:MAG: flagellar biosynthetic protein FliO [Defluviitaleaceae bacterium]|nr:flagellar biosynthetic protein FliO [Defluviitaleaceae bacterium]